MKNIFSAICLVLIAGCGFAQKANNIINAKEVERIERVLASDDMRGRKTFSPEIDKAADFISAEFRKIGLQTYDGTENYRQSFIMVRPKFVSASASLDGVPVTQANLIVVTCMPDLKVSETSGYEITSIKAGGNLTREASALVQAKKNLVVMVDESYAANFPRLAGFKRSLFKTDKSVIFLLSNATPSKFQVEAKNEITEQQLTNVVGVLPGRSKKDEIVVFSGHYDHLGVGAPLNGDSIFNGANDDAAGTTAVIMLAKYFRELNNNERTIIFAAFTAEEIGGFGSQYFSKQLDPAQVMAMFNIEMIGTESKWGKNSAYITGYEKTDMGTILQKNLSGTDFKFYPDPYTEQNLFYRSDNATLARLGVPAHTISTSKMDTEPNYHKLSDQVETLDMVNMARIIESVALSAKGIIAGKETPSRVNVEALK